MSLIKLVYFLIILLSENAFADNQIKQQDKLTYEMYSEGENKEDTKFSSDDITVNEKTKVIIATGNVLIIGKDQKISADKVEYDQNSDKAVATGNVIITNRDGSIYETENATLTNEFKSIVAIPLFGKLKDKSNIGAENFIKNDIGESFFNEGVYTACECNLKEGDTPIWRLESKKIRHDPLTQTVYFKHPIMKIYSVPVYYLPYLSIPDWTVKRRSGFLTPTYGYSKQNRFHIKIPYYYAPESDPTWDMTFTSHQKGKTGHADQLNVRKEYETTSVIANIYKGNLDTNKSEGDNVFAINLKASSELRNNWEVSLEGKYADQETFMRRYGFDGASTYKSFINLDKLSEKSISNIEIYNIQNLDETISNNEPVLAPSISHHIFNSNEQYNYDIKFKAHSIYNDENYDIKRWSGVGKINKKISYDNLFLEADANIGLDLYSIQGRPSTDSNDNRYIDRISSGFSIAASQQYILMNDTTSISIEPKIQFSSVFSSDRTDEVPNRDSAEFRLDQANLFLNNQLQGRDNIQKSDRINLGVTSLLMTENLGDINFFIGQSQKVSGTQKNVTVANQDRQSHVINSIDWNPSKMFNFSWFSLYNHHDFKSDISDFGFHGSINNWNYGLNHKAVDKEFIFDNVDREELSIGLSKNFSNWKTAYGRTYNLSDGKEELLSESLIIGYSGSAGYMFGNCLTILLSYKNEENLGAVDRDLLPENSINLTFNFRNLGEYIWVPKLPTVIRDIGKF